MHIINIIALKKPPTFQHLASKLSENNAVFGLAFEIQECWYPSSDYLLIISLSLSWIIMEVVDNLFRNGTHVHACASTHIIQNSWRKRTETTWLCSQQ